MQAGKRLLQTQKVLVSGAAYAPVAALVGPGVMSAATVQLRHADGTSITTNAASVTSSSAPITMTTWNIAAVNNNPFEYWITHDDAAYNALMDDVQSFIDAPGDRDVAVDTVFTPEMFSELAAKMTEVGFEGIDAVTVMWEADYRGRKIISGFMKDKDIGNKRLASMPDRITNTINTLDEGAVCRPTAINCYNVPTDSVEEWWVQWKAFHFDRKVLVKEKKGTSEVRQAAFFREIRGHFPVTFSGHISATFGEAFELSSCETRVRAFYSRSPCGACLPVLRRTNTQRSRRKKRPSRSHSSCCELQIFRCIFCGHSSFWGVIFRPDRSIFAPLNPTTT